MSRLLYYSQAHGRGVIGEVTSTNELFDVRELPEGTFATDWTAITSLGGGRVLYYNATTGRGVIGAVVAILVGPPARGLTPSTFRSARWVGRW